MSPPRLPPAFHAVAMGLFPLRYGRWRLRHDSDPFEARFPGFPPMLVTGHRDGARDVFRAPAGMYDPPQPNPIGPLVGDASVMLATGERHRKARAFLMPPFHGERMRLYGNVIQDSTTREIERWERGALIDIRSSARVMALAVILEVVLGVDDHKRSSEYGRTVAKYLDAYTAGLLLAPPLRRKVFGRGPWARFVKIRDKFDELIDVEIARRKASGTDDRTDILSMLLRSTYDDGSTITDDDLREQLRALLVAGHETTATSLTWALYEVHRNPAVLAALLAELDDVPDPTPDRIAKLPYLSAVCQETLRLHPPVPVVLRKLLTPLTVRGRTVPAGNGVAVATLLLHNDPDVWPEPTQFRPERFVERRYTPFEYAPFGGGHRRCIGFALAEYELRITLATILRQVRLDLSVRDRRLPAPTAVPRNLATAPRRAIKFRVGERRQAGRYDGLSTSTLIT